jgi:hypothetical protein
MSEQQHHVSTTAQPTPLGPGRAGEAGGSAPASPEDSGRQFPDPWEGYSIEVLRAVLDP